MKASIKKIVSAYKVLGDAKVTKLEEGEVIKVVKARKAMRPIADDFDAFLKDCQEKLKPEGWDEIQKKLQQWQQEGENTSLTEAECIELNKAVIGYQKKIDAAMKDELKREVELNIEPLKEESATKMLVENGWEVRMIDELGVVF
jgi:hypothetical protein